MKKQTKPTTEQPVARYFSRPVFAPSIPLPPVRRSDGKLVDAFTGMEVKS